MPHIESETYSIQQDLETFQEALTQMRYYLKDIRDTHPDLLGMNAAEQHINGLVVAFETLSSSLPSQETIAPIEEVLEALPGILDELMANAFADSEAEPPQKIAIFIEQ